MFLICSSHQWFQVTWLILHWGRVMETFEGAGEINVEWLIGPCWLCSPSQGQLQADEKMHLSVFQLLLAASLLSPSGSCTLIPDLSTVAASGDRGYGTWPRQNITSAVPDSLFRGAFVPPISNIELWRDGKLIFSWFYTWMQEKSVIFSLPFPFIFPLFPLAASWNFLNFGKVTELKKKSEFVTVSLSWIGNICKVTK